MEQLETDAKTTIKTLISYFNHPNDKKKEISLEIAKFKRSQGIIDEKIIDNPTYVEKVLKELDKNNVLDSLDEIKILSPENYYKFWVHSYPIMLFSLPIKKIETYGDESYSKKYLSFSVENENLVIIEDEFITLHTKKAREIVEGLNIRIDKNPSEWSILRNQTKRVFDINGMEIERYVVKYIDRDYIYRDIKNELENNSVGPLSYGGNEKSIINIKRNDDMESAYVYRQFGETGGKGLEYSIKLENLDTLDISDELNNLITNVTLDNRFNYDINKIPPELAFNVETKLEKTKIYY